MKTVIITYAVNEEFIPVNTKSWDVKYIKTSVGKTLSAMLLTKAAMEYKPSLVVNIGSAGTLIHNVGEIFVCRKFVDRDYKATKLPGLEYEIDSSKIALGDEWMEKRVGTTMEGSCSTGDTFVTEIGLLDEDVVDMEAYAQALVCREFGIPFVSVKYVTDVIGKNSVELWEEKLADAREALVEWFSN